MAETRSNSIMNRDLDINETAKDSDATKGPPPQKPQLSSEEKKNGLLSKFHETFFQGRNLTDVAVGVIKNWLIPSILDGIATTAKATIDGMFYGDNGTSNTYHGPNMTVNRNPSFYNSLTRSNVSGGGIVASGGTAQPQNPQFASMYRQGFQNIVFRERTDAIKVLTYLQDCIAYYGMARVADFYDSAGSAAANIYQQFTDNSWGWRNLTGVMIVRVLDGYMITLPDPVCLK